MRILVTCSSGFEAEAKGELKGILGRANVSMTYFRGLLRVDTSCEDAPARLRESDTTYISKAIPIQGTVQADIDVIKAFFKDTIPEGSFAVRCKRRGSHSFSGRDVEAEVGSMLTKKGAKVDLNSPATILWVDIIQDLAHLSVLSPEDIVKKTPKVERRWKKGERPVSRAELKMREIMEAFPEIFRADRTALDIGAAPGGWTRAMATKLKKVIAVDRAELDGNVKALENVVHLKERAEDLKLDEKVDIISNDANLLHMQSAKISIKLAEKYLKIGDTLIHTVKFGIIPKTGKLAAKSLNHAAGEVKEEFEKAGITVQIGKLEHNTRNETTIIGRI